MIILALKTDQPESEVYIYKDSNIEACIKWEANRQLGATIHKQLEALYKQAGITSKNLDGIVIYKGPGSFTGLRIGFTVANTIADVHQIPIVSCAGEDWAPSGVAKIKAGTNEKIALPEYGGPAHTTKPRK